MAPAWLFLPPGAELLPVPQRLPWDPAPCPAGIWGDLGFSGVCRSWQLLSPLRGLPGGGTADTDASQGKAGGRNQGCRAVGTGRERGNPGLAVSHSSELSLLLPGRETRPFLRGRDKRQGTGGAEGIFQPDLG